MGANEAEELSGNAALDDFECILAGLLICGGRKLPLAMHDIGLYAWERCCYWDKVTVMTWDLGDQGGGEMALRLSLAKMMYHEDQWKPCETVEDMFSTYDDGLLIDKK